MPELSGAVFDLPVNQVSDIVESNVGFHIVRVDNTRVDDGEAYAQVRQIIVRKETFGQWLGAKMSDFTVKIPPRHYEWNNEENIVDFSSEDMRAFEQKARESRDGDFSIL